MTTIPKSNYITNQLDVQIYSPDAIAIMKLHKVKTSLQLCHRTCFYLSLGDFDDQTGILTFLNTVSFPNFEHFGKVSTTIVLESDSVYVEGETCVLTFIDKNIVS